MAERLLMVPNRDEVSRLPGWPLPPEAHAGLVWDRYLEVWTGAADNPSVRSPLFEPLKQFAVAFNARGRGERNHARDLLRFHQLRLSRAAELWGKRSNNQQIRSVEFTVEWRLAIGLGLDHPSENGFSFDPVIGVPYLPGSSVKGMCRRMAQLSESEATVTHLFGSADISEETTEGQGKLVFFDAYPKRWPTLAVDIINTHHPQYYRELGHEKQTESNPSGSPVSVFPSETENPVPVFFLTVDRSSVFTFRLGGKATDVEKAESLLVDGLDWLGIGAKTAVGYGRLSP